MSIRARAQRTRVLLVLGLTAVMVNLVPSPGSAEHAQGVATGPTHVGSLGIEDSLFWEGYIEDSIGDLTRDGACNEPTAYCMDYVFEVTETADRLRVAESDGAPAYDSIGFHLFDPNGSRVFGAGAYSAEVFVEDPPVGTWTVRVVGGIAEDADYFMRAKLEDLPEPTPARHNNPRALLPNLRYVPPFDFTFTAPAAVMGFGVGARVGDASPATCTPYETLDGGSKLCLRFSTGVENVGDGPLEVLYEPGADPGTAVPVTQIVRYENGDEETRPAGSASYHASHAHYHHDGFGVIKVEKVNDLKHGDTTFAGESSKQGFCLINILLADWLSFDQAPVGDMEPSSCETQATGDTPAQGSRMALAKGWADIYWWSMDANHVDLEIDEPGLYVVSSTADPHDLILETDERDNTGYTLISISDKRAIEVLERGYGEGPWDPQKTVIEDPRLRDLADTQWLPFNDLL